jgi:hypothetical protein
MMRAKPTAKKRPRKAAPNAARETEVARSEVLGFAAQLLPALPLEIKIGVQANGLPSVIQIASKSHAPAESGALGAEGLWFDGEELRALAVAAQSERIWSSDFKGYCLRKLHDPSFRVTEAMALSGARPDTEPAWSLARVLHWLELDLVAIEFSESKNETEAQTAAPRAPAAAAA